MEDISTTLCGIKVAGCLEHTPVAIACASHRTFRATGWLSS